MLKYHKNYIEHFINNELATSLDGEDMEGIRGWGIYWISKRFVSVMAVAAVKRKYQMANEQKIPHNKIYSMNN